MNDKKPKQDTTTPAMTQLLGALADFLMTRTPGSAPCEWKLIADAMLAAVPDTPGSANEAFKQRKLMVNLLVYAVATAMRGLVAVCAKNEGKLPEGCAGCSKRANTMAALGIKPAPGQK